MKNQKPEILFRFFIAEMFNNCLWRITVKRFYGIVLLVVLFAYCSSVPVEDQDAGITTVFLVRHAEKMDDGSDDPPLSPAGTERAQKLAYVLKDVALNAVYDTPYKRTHLTAQPAAEDHGLAVETIPSLRLENMTVFVDDVLEKHAGGNILIVSHSNIVPALIK